MVGRESDWRRDAENSVLLKSVSHWREKPERWFRGSYDRLPETVRVNPMSEEKDWVESWLRVSVQIESHGSQDPVVHGRCPSRGVLPRRR